MENADCETLVAQINSENYANAQVSLEAILKEKCAQRICTVLQQDSNEH